MARFYIVCVKPDCSLRTVRVAGRLFNKGPITLRAAELTDEIRRSPLLEVVEVEPAETSAEVTADSAVATESAESEAATTEPTATDSDTPPPDDSATEQTAESEADDAKADALTESVPPRAEKRTVARSRRRKGG